MMYNTGLSNYVRNYCTFNSGIYKEYVRVYNPKVVGFSGITKGCFLCKFNKNDTFTTCV